MASTDALNATIRGRGGHAAMPYQAIDPIPVACEAVGALQSYIARAVPFFDAAVISITQIHAGSAYNVIPEEASLAGTIRTFSPEIASLVHERMRTIAQGIALSFGMEITVDIRPIFEVLVNGVPQNPERFLEAGRSAVQLVKT